MCCVHKVAKFIIVKDFFVHRICEARFPYILLKMKNSEKIVILYLQGGEAFLSDTVKSLLGYKLIILSGLQGMGYGNYLKIDFAQIFSSLVNRKKTHLSI